ncbi:hypothetical protein E2562_016282 [Oryza meyeriana var. granulata]|uniref:Ozone-responsive stress related protein n=2 Tax=Oryza meyeriana var. granulata TaxID=110450 RepID=A0A6G1CPR5_9ORYZ|nr:hypothetical protein E2562_016282 [Oryza meyeriana var. granulata]
MFRRDLKRGAGCGRLWSIKIVDSAKMTAGYIVGSLVGSFAIAYLCDAFVSDKKAFGGSIPKTVSDKEWWQATDTKFQAWPRTAGPPVIMNPISRQNFIVKSTE